MNERDDRGRFGKGNGGGPGRARGSRNRNTILLDEIAQDAAVGLLRTVIEAAQGGDLSAAKLVLDRVWPAAKSRPVCVNLPQIRTAADLVEAQAVITEALAAGAITPDEAAMFSSVIANQGKTLETAELEQRLIDLERCLNVRAVA